MAANDAVSRVQFYNEVAGNTLREGGDTVHAETGDRPTSGFMVSTGTAESTTPAAGYGPHKVGAYVNRHKEALSQPDTYLGTWREGQGQGGKRPSDIVYTEQSRLHPSSGDALDAMRATNQKATWHIDKGEEYSMDYMESAHATTQPNQSKRKRAT